MQVNQVWNWWHQPLIWALKQKGRCLVCHQKKLTNVHIVQYAGHGAVCRVEHTEHPGKILL